jgi:peptide deformylase
MAIHRVAQLGHPAIRSEATPVLSSEIGTQEFKRLVADLIDTMRDYGGVGIAAPQIRVPKRLFVIEVRDATRYRNAEPFPLTVVLNPSLAVEGPDQDTEWEGCLSIEGLRGQVPRFTHVLLTGLDAEGSPLTLDLHGFPAIVAQHEFDHLNGLVYLDRMTSMSTLTFVDEFQRYHRAQAPEQPLK